MGRMVGDEGKVIALEYIAKLVELGEGNMKKGDKDLLDSKVSKAEQSRWLYSYEFLSVASLRQVVEFHGKFTLAPTELLPLTGCFLFHRGRWMERVSFCGAF